MEALKKAGWHKRKHSERVQKDAYSPYNGKIQLFNCEIEKMGAK
jgi:hypothetical protein